MRWLILLIVASAALLAADISGTWTAEVMLDVGSGTATFQFKQTGETLAGTYSGTFGEAAVTGTIKGDQVSWTFDGGQAGKATYKGTLAGDAKMSGTVEYAAVGGGKFTATKK